METNKVEWMVLILLQDQGIPHLTSWSTPAPQLGQRPHHPPAPPPHTNVTITVMLPKNRIIKGPAGVNGNDGN